MLSLSIKKLKFGQLLSRGTSRIFELGLQSIRGLPQRQSHRRSGLANLPSVGAVS